LPESGTPARQLESGRATIGRYSKEKAGGLDRRRRPQREYWVSEFCQQALNAQNLLARSTCRHLREIKKEPRDRVQVAANHGICGAIIVKGYAARDYNDANECLSVLEQFLEWRGSGGLPKRRRLTLRGQYPGNRATLIMDDKETLTAEIEQLQGKYTVAVKAYAIIKNATEREKAKALIASLGKQIDDLKKRLKALPPEMTGNRATKN
jgi:hypothetical protein